MPLRKPRSDGVQPLYDVRVAKNMTQVELAKATSIPQPRISELETGRYVPTRLWLVKLTKVLRLRPEDLFTEAILAEVERRYKVAKAGAR